MRKLNLKFGKIECLIKLEPLELSFKANLQSSTEFIKYVWDLRSFALQAVGYCLVKVGNHQAASADAYSRLSYEEKT